MSDEDQYETWIKNFNKGHGYAGVFNAETDEEKTIVELSTAAEWVRSVEAEFGIRARELKSNSMDPPDCFVKVDGLQLGVELVQMVESDHKRRATQDENPNCGELFLDMQWSKDRLVSKLEQLIVKKGVAYSKRSICVDVLLIHTAEPWLDSTQAEEWLADIQIKKHPSINSAFLLFEYEPGRGVSHWPVFCLYGDLSQ